ncbi:Uroporphyrinogen decarboxylase [Gemmata obscuriglobus]|uniref:Uroporphyrinogen decarboxylase n=1 Tax=Gemmata obscuriglobus TaxID=114 RepID=A0A2Z3GTW1_9BACT|nr:uroporphyrinogen decarboxylase family protein [Gemmata obscuriglobus]AWM36698.1 uroporphyrinogen decarboxylase [Gemmata obscuriglobus]QEG30657.1 Uroporphyrinogen decarboxylase [Gemmata obscuriglobus]VTS09984.1 uroporphyrinogen decarboxylase : Uroporphyrinogen decarboxylase OS=Halovivax asiaticus JCM 14624 GN=hemE PE=3 SV=1: URO-D [Gemmata obscuriglobus UQM 2246]
MPDAFHDKHLLIRAARGERVERAPVWAMRQAGRWDPEFRKVRAGMSFFEFSENVEASTRASLCPRRFGVDAIILFYDITTLPVAMGLPFELKPGAGPVPDRPVRTLGDLDRLAPNPAPETYAHIRQLLKRVKDELHGDLPVLVFAGAPFTVATYCIGTGKDVEATRAFVADAPAVWNGLLERLTGATVGFLRTLIGDGADAYQLFDSWAGALSPAEYDAWAQPQHSEILAGATGVPRILFVKEGPYLERMCATGADVISLGSVHDLAAARRDHPHLVFQGNVDEEILRGGTPEQVADAVRACRRAGGGARHILNLNHGVDKDTPVANFEAYVRAAKAPAEA